MYASFSATGYSGMEGAVASASAKTAISALMFLVPPALIIVSLIVFSGKYKIYGDFKQQVIETVNRKYEADNEE